MDWLEALGAAVARSAEVGTSCSAAEQKSEKVEGGQRRCPPASTERQTTDSLGKKKGSHLDGDARVVEVGQQLHAVLGEHVGAIGGLAKRARGNKEKRAR